MSTVWRAQRIASTAVWSTIILSPRPIQRAAANAAASVARTSSSARLRSRGVGIIASFLKVAAVPTRGERRRAHYIVGNLDYAPDAQLARAGYRRIVIPWWD